MFEDMPDFEAEATEETTTGREELNTERAARSARRWAERNIDAVENVKLRDRRPQHEGQRDGAVTFTIRLREGAGLKGLTDVHQFAEEIDAEGVTTSRCNGNDHKGQFRVIISKWSSSFPVYSDYFGMKTQAFPNGVRP